jgi:hypothetical protein
MTVQPVTIRNKITEKVAVRLTEENLEDARQWVQDRLPEGGGTVYVRSGEDKGLLIPTLEGIHTCPVGHWVIRGLKGEFYGCDPDIFEQSYELVS